MINILRTIDIKDILDCYYKIENDIVWTEYGTGRQAGIQYNDGGDIWTSAVGRQGKGAFNYNKINKN